MKYKEPIIFNSEYTRKLLDYEPVFNAVNESFGHRDMNRCGSYLVEGLVGKYQLDFNMHLKQQLLYDLCKDKSSVLEIGTHMGHSALIMLMSNPKMNLTLVDLCDTFAGPASKALADHFVDANIRFHCIDLHDFIVSDDISNRYDLIHLDCNYSEDDAVLLSDILFLSKFTNHMVVDDITDPSHILDEIRRTYHNVYWIQPDGRAPNLYMRFKDEV